MKKFIIDADTGSDDAVAILLALQDPTVEVLGISVVSGNVPLKQGIMNTISTIDMTDKKVKVYAGEEKPISRNYEEVHDLANFLGHVKSLSPSSVSGQCVHGVDGMGDIGVKPSTQEFEEKKAIDFIVETINEQPNEITLVTLGPLTNIALAIQKDKSIINRLGFNNSGVDRLVLNLKQRKSSIPIGISIGKNFDTPIELAVEDYSKCMKKVYQYSDYIAINISSPNTLHLRDLSNKEYLDSLLGKLKSIQNELSLQYGYKPMYLKISPDEELHNIKQICASILEKKIDGIICTNTTIDHQHGLTLGGLSGAPLKNKSNQILKTVKDIVDTKVSIIASGGVMSDADYQEKLNAGADLVQIYTGFIYKGPQLIKDILNLPTS